MRTIQELLDKFREHHPKINTVEKSKRHKDVQKISKYHVGGRNDSNRIKI